MSFRTEQGNEFFRATLVQTLFYGLFSAWVIHHETQVRDNFNWRGAAHQLNLQVLQRLFSEITRPAAMKSLNLAEVMDNAQEVLQRVNRKAFFKNFSEQHAVQYFYEPFLQAYDPELRRQFGVWYTPDEVVTYMVEQVDRALRDDLNLPLGLASPEVVILDPCTGTGTYILKVLERIHRTLQETGQADAFSGHDLKEIALKRVFGFELMPAPFVVAHMRLNMQLKQFGIELGEDERMGVYLTNALTGYVDKGGPDLSNFGEFLSEWQVSSSVKQREPVLVVLGNPPYSSFAGIGMSEEQELGNAYREVQNVPKPVGQGLNDLYVRFFRMAERHITHPKEGKQAQGVVAFISNYSWLDGLSHTGMREHYLQAFDRITVDNLNGDRFRTGKLTPEGKPDPSIFSTQFNREGIQVGTAIATMVRKVREPNHDQAASVQYRELWGAGKLQQLLLESTDPSTATYQGISPDLRLGAPFRPVDMSGSYMDWPPLPALFPASFPGVKTSRDRALVSIDKEPLQRRVADYLDPKKDNEEILNLSPDLMTSTARFNAASVRATLVRAAESAAIGEVIQYAYRPFDIRWLYWVGETKLLDEKRAEYVPHLHPKNQWLVSQQKPRGERDLPQVVRPLGCLDLMDRGANFIPLYIDDGLARIGAIGEQHQTPNLSPQALSYVQELGGEPEMVFFHAVAIMHSNLYNIENQGALRQDWPRIPLPLQLTQLAESAALGRQVADLMDQTTVFSPSADVKSLGSIQTVNGQKGTDQDLQVSMRWGNLVNGAVMPGRGRTESTPPAFDRRLGTEALRVYLSPNLYLDNVPVSVWEYKLGGYQVLKKWLSYREFSVLGRALELREIREFGATIQRIASLLLLSDELDANYRRISVPATAQAVPAGAAAEAEA